MNPYLKFFESRFATFGFIFLTGMLRLASFVTDPDPSEDAVSLPNPYDKLSSLFQQFVYLTSLLLLIARKKTSARTLIRDPLIWTLPLMAVLSFLWSDFPANSKRRGITIIQTSYFGLYVASRFTVRQQLQMLGWAFGIITVFSFLFCLAFPGTGIEMGANAGSWRGPFAQKNLLARFMVLSAIIFLLLALDNPKYPKVSWGLFGLSVLMILLTGSKTALLLFLTVIMLLPFYKLLRNKDTLIIPVVVLGILIGGSVLIFVTSNWLDILAALGRDPTLSGRTTLWEIAIMKIKQRFWLGYGFQAFWVDGGGAVPIWQHEGYKPPHAHNGFVNMGLDLGVLGLILFLLTIISNYLRSIIWLRSSNSMADLFPIFYITFFFMYNHTESTIIEPNSLFWALLVSISLSMKRVKPQSYPAPPLPVPETIALQPHSQ